MRINVVDAGCGIGKTTAMINKINKDNSDQKYLFVTPFLSEVERIKKMCSNKNFIAPESDLNKTKMKSILKLFNDGENIVTTHALFKRFNNEMMNEIKDKNYILIIDEVADMVEELTISKSDLKLLSENYISVNPRTHIIDWTDDTYSGKLNEYMNMIKMNNVFAYADKDNKIVSLMWLFPYRIFESFKQVFILTYMFNAQIQKKYFDYFNAEYINWYVKDFQLTTEKQIYDYSKTKSLINICDSDKLNYIGEKRTDLSLSWFNRNKNTYKMLELQNNIRSFFRSHTKISSENVLWTTFKEYKKYIKRKGFINSFASINSRATNEYGHKRAVAYIGNRFLKPTIKNFFTFNNIPINKDFEDEYALSELIQFVYRSGIRNGKQIDVYVPSRRMRTLLINWIKKPNI